MTYSFNGFDHVQLAAPAGCEEEARRFYGDILGMEEIEKPDELKKRGGVWFRCGAHQIHIGVDPHFSPAQKAHPAIHVHDLSALRARLAEYRVPVKEDDLLPGADRFYVDDPFGNRLEFLEWRDGHAD
jgi:catechol 2,3-dioxygenase-like lactoylglutathione lyase family enzyme